MNSVFSKLVVVSRHDSTYWKCPGIFLHFRHFFFHKWTNSRNGCSTVNIEFFSTIDFVKDSVDVLVIAVKTVIAGFISHILKDENEGGNTKCQPHNVKC